MKSYYVMFFVFM